MRILKQLSGIDNRIFILLLGFMLGIAISNGIAGMPVLFLSAFAVFLYLHKNRLTFGNS